MSLGDVLAKTARDIETHGWSSVGVFPDADSTPPGPTFTYSVGFYEHNEHPEMIVLGLHPAVAHSIIGGLYTRVAAGEVFEDGQIDDEVLEGYDVAFKALPPDGAPCNVARRYYGVDELPALQVVWPDAEGRFPEDAGFDPKFAGRQDIELARR